MQGPLILSQNTLIVRHLGLRHWEETSLAMHQFTDLRDSETGDEVWLVEHYPVFTQGQAGKASHLLNPGDIPVVQSDRGGQVTYHGPGQIIMYTLIDLKRRSLGVRQLVSAIEQTVVDTLADFGLMAKVKADAPGVYIEQKKICSLGLRIRRGCSFHGLALNVTMDLAPFERINPCGYAGLKMTQLSEVQNAVEISDVQSRLVKHFMRITDFIEVEYRSTLPFINQ